MKISESQNAQIETLVYEMKHHFVELARTNNLYHLLTILDYSYFIRKTIDYNDKGEDLDIRVILLKFYNQMTNKTFDTQLNDAKNLIKIDDYEGEANILRALSGDKEYFQKDYTTNFTTPGLITVTKTKK